MTVYFICIICAAYTKALYQDDSFYAELECKSSLQLGVCPPDQAAIYVYHKQYETTQEQREKMLEIILKNTHGCYDLGNFVFTEQNSKCK